MNYLRVAVRAATTAADLKKILNVFFPCECTWEKGCLKLLSSAAAAARATRESITQNTTASCRLSHSTDSTAADAAERRRRRGRGALGMGDADGSGSRGGQHVSFLSCSSSSWLRRVHHRHHLRRGQLPLLEELFHKDQNTAAIYF